MLPYKIHVLIQEYEPDSLSIGGATNRTLLHGVSLSLRID
jgi:hypothetical protein